MALQDNDLFLIQSQVNSQLFKLRLDTLVAQVNAASPINLKGVADLNSTPAASGIIPPYGNGDMYLVISDATPINDGWVMQGGEVFAKEGNRVVYNSETGTWILVTSGSTNTGTVNGVLASLPLESDGNHVTPLLSIVEARTTTAADAANDGKGTAGAVHRIADADDVVHTTGTADNRAVVTADLLKATNDRIESAVSSVSTDDANTNGALTITPTSGDVKVEISNADEGVYGVVQIASSTDIADGTSGSTAIVDASQLKGAIDSIPVDSLQSLAEGGTDVVTGALQIATDTEYNVTIGVNEAVFVPHNFADLPDITAE